MLLSGSPTASTAVPAGAATVAALATLNTAISSTESTTASSSRFMQQSMHGIYLPRLSIRTLVPAAD